MKVFLDTNVLVSAVATRGLCADVLREVLISHHLILSTHLLAELEGVFRKKVNLPENLISEFLKMIQQDALFSTPSAKPDVNLQDKSDLPILSSALTGGADLLVTGDNELLDLRKIGNMEIVSPRGFWEKLKTRS
jgi:putative PIN family toxin of toxin-antitoxin system